MSIYLIAMPIIAGVCLALGIFIGRLDVQNRKDREELSELEQLSIRYRPLIKEINEEIEHINSGAA